MHAYVQIYSMHTFTNNFKFVLLGKCSKIFHQMASKEYITFKLELLCIYYQHKLSYISILLLFHYLGTLKIETQIFLVLNKIQGNKIEFHGNQEKKNF